MLKRLFPIRLASLKLHRLAPLTFVLGLAAALPFRAAAAPTRPQIDVTNYVITADLDPGTAHLTATAAVTFTALDDLTSVTFELNNGLQITAATDAAGKPLQNERLTTNSSLRINPNAPIPKGTSTTFTLQYAGALVGSDTSPVEGIKMAAIADPISMLLYPGAWFPISMPGLYTDRFTSELHVIVPTGERVIASGFTGTKPSTTGKTEFDFNWKKPGFPGTVVAGKFAEAIPVPGASNIKVYVTEARKKSANTAPLDLGRLASRQLEFLTSTFGQLSSPTINIVELPEDAVSASWGPEVVAMAGNRIADPRNASRLLSNTLAHQWWGNQVSPATLNDAWITNGMSRYAELMTLEDSAGKNAFTAAVTDVSAGALAYDTEPLSSLGRLDPFSPQFQSMTLEKGAMVFHMLRWEMGDAVFTQFLRGVLSQYSDQPVKSSQLEEVASIQAKENMTAFFAQWVDGTGAPTFTNKYTVFRLGDGKGFRTIGALQQDLDLFRMPIALRIETDGKTEDRRVDLAGTESQFSVETFGRPRRITVDPENWVLKSTPDLAVRVAILKGQMMVGQGDLTAALAEYQKALDLNKNSSLASYRIGEIFMTQRNYQSAANSFRDSLRGDAEPRWTEVWCHIELGRIFDLTGQRDRAVNEYRLAVQTNDNTQGAINEARALMQKPYERPKAVD